MKNNAIGLDKGKCTCTEMSPEEYHPRKVVLYNQFGGIIAVDECMVQEVALLMRCGIRIISCSCGPNPSNPYGDVPYIAVHAEDADLMYSIGYSYHGNSSHSRGVSFKSMFLRSSLSNFNYIFNVTKRDYDYFSHITEVERFRLFVESE